MNLDWLQYDFNAIADIEEKAGMPIGTLFTEGRLSFHTLRLLVWGGLKARQPNITVAVAGTYISNYAQGGGDMEYLGQRIITEIEKSGLFENFTKAGD